ncbi:glycoside hydrolase family 43 protein [Fontivita pretiosa]|uniref:glycoside hydrolase family 43 protein n=1 Tax=Fontivita pretiosa TaxID=2989684 RepID=UPI003D16E89A
MWLDTEGKPIQAHGGGILFHEGYFYWYGESWGTAHKWDRQGVRIYRSRDLTHWENRGLILPMSQTPGDPLEVGCIIERPKILHNPRTGKFVLWFHHELKGRGYGAAQAGVAVADDIEGPYRLVRSSRPVPGHWPMNYRPSDAGAATQPAGHDAFDIPPGLSLSTFDPTDRKYKRLIDGYRTGQESRDMTAFRDDDGTAYLIYSSEMNATLHVAELTEDYLGYTGRFVRVFPGRAREAPVVFKRQGKYYMITSGCTGWKPNPSDAAVADSIWGPWRSLGNPWQGSEQDRQTSFRSQGTFALSIPGSNGNRVLFMADRWTPEQGIAYSTYVWAPIEWDGDSPILRFREQWNPNSLLEVSEAFAN